MGRKPAHRHLTVVTPGASEDGVAFLVLDGKSGVIRASGWEPIFGRQAPTRIPPPGLLPGTLEDAIASAVQEAGRTGGAAWRTAPLGMHRGGSCVIIAGCVSPSRAGRRTAVVVNARAGAASVSPSEGQAIRMLSHDLRSPLTSISGAAELLQSGRLGDMTEQQAKCLGVLRRGIDNLLEVLESATSAYRPGPDRDAADGALSGRGAAGR